MRPCTLPSASTGVAYKMLQHAIAILDLINGDDLKGFIVDLLIATYNLMLLAATTWPTGNTLKVKDELNMSVLVTLLLNAII